MGKKGTRQKKKTKAVALKKMAPVQLSFDLDLPSLARIQPNEQGEPFIAPIEKVLAEVEIIPPSSRLEQAISTNAAPSAGQIEHQFLRDMADKYEERALRTVPFFIIACVLAVLAKAGIPVTQGLLEKLGLPTIKNVRLLAGMLGAAVTVFALILGYYALRIRQHSPQLQLRLVQRSIAGMMAQWMLYGGIALLLVMLVVAVLLTWRDILYMATYVWDRLWYVMDGWEIR